MNNEIWKPLIYKDIKHIYEISNYGRIRNIKSGKILTSVKNISNDHYQISLRLNKESGKWNGKRTFSLHVLVANIFIPNPDNKPIIHHIDGDPSNNHISNLMWVTVSEHQVLTYELEQRDRKIGEANINSKYNSDQYHKIIELIKDDKNIPISEISYLTGISVNMIREFIHDNVKWFSDKDIELLKNYEGFQSITEKEMRNVFYLAQSEDVSVADISRLTGVNISTISSIVNHCAPIKWKYLYNEYDIPNRNKTKDKIIIDKKTTNKIHKLLKSGMTPKEVISKLNLDSSLNLYNKIYRLYLQY